MVISKEHVQSMLELNDDQRCELMRLSARAAESITELFDADSINWTIHDRPPAGMRLLPFFLFMSEDQKDAINRVPWSAN